jgi:lambda family phage portal protein
MFGWFKSRASSPQPAAPPRPTSFRIARAPMHARFDSAVTNDENRRHWAYADGLSPTAALSIQVRLILRNRARYEVANNSYAKGIVLTLANDVVGTGPRLQMLTDDDAANGTIEQAFCDWADAVGLADKLRTMRMARADSGEAFAVLTSNPRLDSPITLDLKLVEADQVTTPVLYLPYPQPVDGIVFDDHGNPIEYHILRRHPGDVYPLASAGAMPLAFDPIPAASVIHYFRVDRPGQRRGIPDITPALPLFAQLRRYTLAVIAAAETAADFAAVLYTDSPANGEADAVEPMDIIDLERRMATVLPGGWKLGQITAEQPATTYGEFKKEILNEIARCLNMPFNVAAGNSSGYNYASGRLDHQTYFKSIRIDQAQMESVVLDHILKAWMDEAVLVEGLLPQSLRSLDAKFPHQWFWVGLEHVDPSTEATAQATRLQNNTTTLAYEFARQGRDWEAELRQRAKEVALMEELGLPVTPNPPASTSPSSPANNQPSKQEPQYADTGETDD